VWQCEPVWHGSTLPARAHQHASTAISCPVQVDSTFTAPVLTRLPPVTVDCVQAYKPLCASSERNMSVMWGKLAADTLTGNYEQVRPRVLQHTAAAAVLGQAADSSSSVQAHNCHLQQHVDPHQQ